MGARRPRVLVVPLTIEPPGGGSAVGAWAIEALRDHCDLTVFCWAAPDLGLVNRTFGTTLRVTDAAWRLAPAALRSCFRLLPTPLALLQLQLNMRLTGRIVRSERFDVVLGTMNELHVVRPVVDYIHFPWAAFPRPAADHRWYHLGPALDAYRSIAMRIGGAPAGAGAANTTVANSRWTAERFAGVYGRSCAVLYPPVRGSRFAFP